MPDGICFKPLPDARAHITFKFVTSPFTYMTRARCTICGKQALYRCKYCGDTLCKEHLPPGMHWCVGSEKYRSDLEKGRPTAMPTVERLKNIDANIFSIFSHNYSYLILFIISLSFFLQLLIPGYTKLFILYPPLVAERPWTLITHLFLHSTSLQHFDHFLINMLVFVFFAPVLERKVGSTKFLLIFFLSGIFAGIGWCLTSDYSALGASGAIYAILAALAVLMPRLRVYLFFFIPLEIWMVAFLLPLYFDVLPLIIGLQDGVAHTAHLSGLLFGLLAGLSLKGQ